MRGRGMTPVLILPGFGSSGPEHWQTRWEACEPSFRRAHMPSWDQPDLEQWLAALAEAVRSLSAAPVIVAHSLGCLAVAHHAARGGLAAGALLVAPPDPAGPMFPPAARSFAPVPLLRLPFRSRLVASQNDPYGGMEFARLCASAWGSELIDVGPRGHINAESALGDWREGRALLTDLLAGRR